MTILNRLLSGWTTLKFVRVALGGLILYSSIESGQVTGIVFGSLVTVLFLLSDGVCCAAGNYYGPADKNNSSTFENTDYEELGAK
jgi:hypothetical protein